MEICYSLSLILSIPKILREQIYIESFSICVHPDNFNGVLISLVLSNVVLFQRVISEQGKEIVTSISSHTPAH